MAVSLPIVLVAWTASYLQSLFQYFMAFMQIFDVNSFIFSWFALYSFAELHYAVIKNE